MNIHSIFIVYKQVRLHYSLCNKCFVTEFRRITICYAISTNVTDMHFILKVQEN